MPLDFKESISLHTYIIFKWKICSLNPDKKYFYNIPYFSNKPVTQEHLTNSQLLCTHGTVMRPTDSGQDNKGQFFAWINCFEPELEKVRLHTEVPKEAHLTFIQILQPKSATKGLQTQAPFQNENRKRGIHMLENHKCYLFMDHLKYYLTYKYNNYISP